MKVGVPCPKACEAARGVSTLEATSKRGCKAAPGARRVALLCLVDCGIGEKRSRSAWWNAMRSPRLTYARF